MPNERQEQEQQKRGRITTRPRRIPLDDGDELWINEDVANEEGITERSVNRGDRYGAPFTYVGNVKYRPIKMYRKWRTSRIQSKNPPRSTSRKRA
jgi:hypothetical protein